jgi:hypothetical protein
MRVAGGLAQIFCAKVTLLHIFQYVPKYRYKVPVEWMVEIIRTDVRKKLAEAKRVLNDAGVEVEVMMLEDGFPSQQILTFMPDCPGERSRRNGPQLRRHDCRSAWIFTAHHGCSCPGSH